MSMSKREALIRERTLQLEKDEAEANRILHQLKTDKSLTIAQKSSLAKKACLTMLGHRD